MDRSSPIKIQKKPFNFDGKQVKQQQTIKDIINSGLSLYETV